ncbi:SHOCT domain-containing protein [Nocardioides zeae]|uniref:SHOCT domain-containing protein n=1 Tax=Nocardioides zeae TaxID=1457234 RepID=A0AAJ1U0Q8_9ACTN|nr:SHOCT domain-containing protein [Nocardioides zeae]MDQ1105440.1 hypothetical protein [Nocardioides zeae]
MTKHKLGLVGVLHVHPDGTIGLVEPGRFSFAFRVPLDAVVGFTEARGSFTRATLSVLGQGGVIAECSTNYGAADRLNRWLGEHRPASPQASASPSPGSSGPGLVADLERLAALHRSDALTAAEYAEAKTRLLG